MKTGTRTQQENRNAARSRRARLLPRAVRRALAWGSVVAVLGSLCAPGWRAQDSPSEYQVKAAFLFNFAKFIDWPDSSFASPQSPFSICVLGTDPFGHALDDALASKAIAGRPVAVFRLKDPVAARQCQIAFISSSEKSRWAVIVAAMRGANVLLVGDTDGFAACGGTIQFTLEERHVRFTINTDAAARARLQISSKLLALARIVRDVPTNGKG